MWCIFEGMADFRLSEISHKWRLFDITQQVGDISPPKLHYEFLYSDKENHLLTGNYRFETIVAHVDDASI